MSDQTQGAGGEAATTTTEASLLDEILSFFGGRAQPMMAQLAEAGKLTLEDVREAVRRAPLHGRPAALVVDRHL